MSSWDYFSTPLLLKYLIVFMLSCPIKVRVFHQNRSCLSYPYPIFGYEERREQKGSSHFDDKLSFCYDTTVVFCREIYLNWTLAQWFLSLWTPWWICRTPCRCCRLWLLRFPLGPRVPAEDPFVGCQLLKCHLSNQVWSTLHSILLDFHNQG